MPAELLKGKPVAKELEKEIAAEVAALKAAGINPHLSVVLVGDDPASAVYVGSKARACERVGIGSDTLTLPATADQDEVISLIDGLNDNTAVHGVLVQLPLPPQIDTDTIIRRVNPRKDVDGFTPENIGRLLLGIPYTVACTPAGILEMLDRYEVDIEGMNVAIVGRSRIVGKPLAALLMQKARGRNCTVTVCHSRTRDIGFFTRSADMVVTAMGSPGYLRGDMVSDGCVVIDVGVNRVEDSTAKKGYRLVGDACFEELEEKASYITPVPGGVGPLTVAMVIKNTIIAAKGD
ncbi:MAG: tetrahydrofolate dehydrogenase/cyclohydrolase catalytic domain-containing protein [bacterium]|jgi:methylenetetrahydrofolate dehydrogenase (NADP+)/methenyltetrahydrofolate cyclohydrolase